MKFAQLSVLAALVFATQGAFAQAPGGPGAPGAPAGGAATDASTVSNAGSSTAAADGTVATDTTITDDTTTITADALPEGEMANTGGEPQLMLLAGMLLATGGLLIRRKTSAQSL